MSRKKKIIVSLISALIIAISGFSFYRSKEDPRVYLNEELNILYANERLQDKNIDEELTLLEDTKLKIIVNRYRKELKHLKGVYFLSDQQMEDFVHKTSTGICILDFGYYYPFVLWKLKKTCKNIEGMYVLKRKYSKSIFREEDIFIKYEKGNFIVGNSRSDIERYLEKEKYLNKVLIDVLEREKRKKLGIFLINLQKAPLAKFNEFYFTGDIVASNNVEFILKLKGKNDIVENFQNISNDKLCGRRMLDKNFLYFRTRKETEIDNLKGFFNYFCFDNRFQEENECMRINNLIANTSITKYVNLEPNTFVYGDFVLKDKSEIEIEGCSDYNELTVNCQMSKKSLRKILEKFEYN